MSFRHASEPRSGQSGPPDARGRWERTKAVFLDALELDDRAREAFLAFSCADDDELRAEVESLLASDAAAGGFGEVPAPAIFAVSEPPSAPHRLAPGAKIGHYTIECFLAAGEWARSIVRGTTYSAAWWRSKRCRAGR